MTTHTHRDPDSTRCTATRLDAPWTFASSAARRLSLPDEVEARFFHPAHLQRIAVPVERDDGDVELLDGYRVRHDDARGPYLGPFRFDAGLDADDCTGLATARTVTAALADVPFGGAAGGIAVDPASLTADERERATRAYARRIDGLGPHEDVVAPGRGADDRTMARVANAADDRIDGPHRAVAVGKPRAIGGLGDPAEIAGRSAAIAAREALDTDLDRDVEGASIAVYGAGPIGAAAARVLEFWDADVVALCSDSAGVAHPDGLDADVAVGYVDDLGAVVEYDGGQLVGTDDVLERDVDALVLAAPGVRVTADNARDVGASLVVEATFGCVSPGGQSVLEEREVTVIPDVLARVGSAVAAHFEWTQGLGNAPAGGARVRNEMAYALGEAFDDVRTCCAAEELPMREAAYVLALSRVAEAHEVVR